jgi:hypothetical protein
MDLSSLLSSLVHRHWAITSHVHIHQGYRIKQLMIDLVG